MQILFIVLNDLSHLQEILEIFIEQKVRGATILDSEGMAKAVLESQGLNFLLDGPFAKTLPEKVNGSKTIFTVIPEDEKVSEVVDAIQSALTDTDEKVIGFMFTLPVSGIYPLKPKKTK